MPVGNGIFSVGRVALCQIYAWKFARLICSWYSGNVGSSFSLTSCFFSNKSFRILVKNIFDALPYDSNAGLDWAYLNIDFLPCPDRNIMECFCCMFNWMFSGILLPHQCQYSKWSLSWYCQQPLHASHALTNIVEPASSLSEEIPKAIDPESLGQHVLSQTLKRAGYTCSHFRHFSEQNNFQDIVLSVQA